MGCADLGGFWSENKDRIGQALPQGIDALAGVLRPGADQFDFAQDVTEKAVHWKMADGRVTVAFCIVPDPRDLDAVLEVYENAKGLQPALVGVFVHQWTDGEGNWDAFAIGPRRAMQHCDRICGSETVQERGPELREDIYALFACGRAFPEPGRAEWAALLSGPVEGVVEQLGVLAAQHDCSQTVDEGVVQWADGAGGV